jgi:hypothetical protein
MPAPRSKFKWHRILLHGQIQRARQELDDLCRSCPSLEGPDDLTALEKRLQEISQRLHALLCASAVAASVDSPKVRQAVGLLLASFPRRLKNQGPRPVALRFAHGPEVVVYLPYYSRRGGRPGKPCKGCFPHLSLLGVFDRCSPSLACDLACLVALLGSFEEVRPLLLKRGVSLCSNTLRRVAYHFARRVRQSQRTAKMFARESLKGRVMVITTDGGRIRVRQDKKARTKKGRKRYSTSWREPKLLLIYAVKVKNGRLQMDKSFKPVIDGLMQGPDALFALLRYYLEEMKISEADKVLVVADGAKWIWKRARALLRGLKVQDEKIHEAVDFYHAMQHLGQAADLSKWESDKHKKTWLKRQSKRLLGGETDKVVKELEGLAALHPSKKMTAELGYFLRHGREHKRMEYQALAKAGLPLGSGAVESAVRRVINLRLKGAGIFWHKSSAEAVLLLRCFAKSGRLQDLLPLAFASGLPLSA